MKPETASCLSHHYYWTFFPAQTLAWLFLYPLTCTHTLHYPQRILWIIKSVQALVMPVVSFPLFVLPHLPFLFILPYGPPRPNAGSVQLGWRCRVNAHYTITQPTPAIHRPGSIIKAEMKWEKRMSAGTALSPRLRFPHGHEEEAHLTCLDRSTAFHTMSVPAGFRDSL